MTIGLLFPRSSLYPGIGFDVIEAFRAGLRHYGADTIKVVTESVGIGGMGRDVYEKAEHLLMNEQADILVAYIDHFAAEKIEPLVAAANRLLLVIDPGASIPTSWAATPNTFHLTLDAAFGSYVVGDMAARNGHKKALFTSCFYDAGYLSCSANVAAYTGKGGSITGNYVAPFKFEEFSIALVEQAIAEQQPDAMLAQFSMDMGALFFKDYAQTAASRQVNFYASPFMMEEVFLDTLPFPFEGIQGFVPWARALNTAANKAYQKAITEDAGREANCFGALAWDAAQFAAAAADAMAATKNNGKKAALALKGYQFDGTRGQIKLDDATNYFKAPLYQATVTAGEDGQSVLKTGAAVANQNELWAEFTAQPMDEVFSRWTNTYLCTT